MGAQFWLIRKFSLRSSVVLRELCVKFFLTSSFGLPSRSHHRDRRLKTFHQRRESREIERLRAIG